MTTPKKTLKARDIERLENTSVASALGGAVGGDLQETQTCPSDTCPTYNTCQCTECLGPTSCCRALQEWTEDLSVYCNLEAKRFTDLHAQADGEVR